MSRFGRLMGLVIPAVLLVAAVVHFRPQGDERQRLTLSFPNQPIPGEAVSLESARAAVDWNIPMLPSVPLKDACTGEVVSLEPVATFVSSPETPINQRQVGVVYTNGLWMSVSPLSLYAPPIAKAGELPTVEDWFPKSDFPKALTTDKVRGVNAWVKELSPDFSCETTKSEPVASGSTPSAQTDQFMSDRGQLFDPTMTADVTWAENGVVVDVSGPYTLKTLEGLVESIR